MKFGLNIVKDSVIIRRALLAGIFITIIPTLLLVTSCMGNQAMNSVNKTIEVNNEVAHFALTYPAKYDKDGPNVSRTGGLDCQLFFLAKTTNMQISSPDPNRTGYVTVSHRPASIRFHIFQPKLIDNRSPHEQLDFILNRQKDPDFDLLSRSTIEICGIEAEQAIYHAGNKLYFWKTPEGDGPKRLVRDIYFNYNGVDWYIGFDSELSMSDNVSADFEQILSSFRILK
jgi:hypothetical protein